MKLALMTRVLTRPAASAAIHPDRMLPFAALLAAVFLWGGSFAAMRLAVQTMNPWSVVWLRMAIALIVILPFVGRLKFGTYRKGDWKLLVPMVLFQPCLYFMLESNALQLTTSSQAGVISALVPLLVAVGAWLILAEPVGKRTIGGLLLSVVGVAVLSFSGRPNGSAVNPLLGNFLELCAMVSAAVNMIMVKRLSDRYNPWLLTALQVFAGSVFFSPGLILLIRNPGVNWTAALMFSIVFLGALVTLAGRFVDNDGIDIIGNERLDDKGELLEGFDTFDGQIIGSYFVIGGPDLGAKYQIFVIDDIFDALNTIFIRTG